MDERVALVTGAGKRVGEVIARALGTRGLRVAVHYNNSRRDAERVASEIGNGAKAFEAELARPDAPKQLVDAVIQEYGRLDVLVNSASNFIRTPLDQMTVETWDKILDVNLRAPFFLSLEASKHMPDGSLIVNMSDLAGYETWPGFVAHGISKAGITQMTRALAHQLAPRIRVNAIAPGVVLLPDDTEPARAQHLAWTTPLRRHGSPEDVAHTVLYFLDAGFVTGDVVFVDGGRHVRY